MAKFKRNRRAKNKIEGSLEGALVKADPLPDTPGVVQRTTALKLVRSPLFSAEFEAVIDLIARDRVYWATRARLERRLLLAPPEQNGDAGG